MICVLDIKKKEKIKKAPWKVSKSEKKKRKSENMFVNDISISQKLRSKGYLSIEKDIMKYK